MTEEDPILKVWLLEYDKLKAEQTQRIGFRDNLLYVTLGLFGTIVSFAASNSTNYYAFLILPWASLILGWTYLVNDEKISAIGRYIRLTLVEKVKEKTGHADVESPTGIGFELASIAAENGYDLLVVADEPLIDAAARDFETHGVTAHSVEADLSTFEGVDRLMAAAQGRQIDLLCANAGHGLGRAFLGQDPKEWKHVIDTNITGTVYLLQKVLDQMVARGEGKVLITGSIAGHIPGTFHAVYNASKAFVDNFADAIRNELKDHENIQITTLKPGATETEFFARADMLDTKVGSAENADAAKVARDGWDALMAGTNNITSGLMNKAQVAASGVLPPEVLAEQHRKMAEPGTAE